VNREEGLEAEREGFATLRHEKMPLISTYLPIHVKMLEDKRDFIRNIKEIVTDHQFYDLNEFFDYKFDL